MKNSPKLRFPEFVNNGEWEEQELGKLGKFLGGGTPSKSVDEYWHGTIPWISSSDINEDDLKTISITRFINEKSVLESATKIVPKESVLFVSRVGTGKLAINSIDLCTSQDFTNFIPIQIYNYFLGYYFLANKSALTSLDQGTSIKGFSKSDLEKFKLTYPKKKEEQQKIADCLSSIDSLISAQSQKVELLKEHKKALMQQLFPQDTEEVPKLRFPEFKNAPKWEEKIFSSYIKLYRGSSPRPIREYLTQDVSGVNWIKIGDTKNAINSILNKVEEKITPKGAEKSRKVKIGELILANSMSYGKTYELAIEGCIYDGWFVLREYEEHFYKPFLLQLLNSEYMQQQYKKLSAGGIVQNISGDIVNKTMLFHTSLQEQQKIADCLNSVDEQITSQARKLETLKEHKKALMQQLFPSKEVD